MVGRGPSSVTVEEGSGNRERRPSVSRRHLSRLPDPYNGARVRPIVGARRRRKTWLKTNGLVSPPPRPLFAPPSSKKGQATGREVRPFPGDTYPGCQTPTMAREMHPFFNRLSRSPCPIHQTGQTAVIDHRDRSFVSISHPDCHGLPPIGPDCRGCRSEFGPIRVDCARYDRNSRVARRGFPENDAMY